MKILFVIPYVGETYGGTSKIVKELAKSLGQLGIKVDLVTTNANGNNCLDVPLNIWLLESSYRIKYFSCWYKGDFIVSFPLAKWLIANIKDYDLVHLHTIFAPMLSLTHWICQLHQVPYIIAPHGMLEPWALAYKANKKKIYYALIEQFGLQKAVAIQATASTEAKNIESLQLFTPITMIPNGIHSHVFGPGVTSKIFYQTYPHLKDKILILFLARIDPKKGLDLLSSAFAKVNQQFPNTHLVVAGPDLINFLPTVKTYFLEAGCLESVTFTGMLSGDLKYSTLAAASIYVAPSYSEGFSMSILEGMSSGLPCVITTGCNFPEAQQADAALVVDIDAEKIANALLWFLNYPLKARKIGDNANKLILEKYTWDNIAKQLIKAYSDILAIKKR